MSQSNGTQRSRGTSLRDVKLEAKSVSLSSASVDAVDSEKYSNKYLIGGISAGVLLLVLLSLWEPQPVQVEAIVVDESLAPSAVASTNVEQRAVATTSFELAEQSRLRRSAQDKLAKLLLIQEELAEVNVDKWANTRLNELVQRAESGDRAYRDGDYEVADTEYGDSLAIAESLKQQSPQILEEALESGRNALGRMDGAGAKEAFARALWVDSESSEALAGLQRADVQDELALWMLKVQKLQVAGDLDQALAASEDLALMDPLSEPVQQLRQQLEQAILERDYTAAMSSGYRYLDSVELAAARSAFSRAAKLRPNLAEVTVALQSVSNAEISQRVGLLTGRARQAEAEEDWQQAVEAYSQVLALESGSIDGLIGQARAQARLTLDRKLVVYRGDFDSLLDPVVREQARATLNQARELPSAGARLLEQIASISAELDKLVGEVNVQLVSDGQTDVRILRQSRLGMFQQEELVLSPGKYVAVGSRSGFRDVRLEFVVRSGEPIEPLSVACTEAI
jgi:tetratricopeptide (TPR) repeat protein